MKFSQAVFVRLFGLVVGIGMAGSLATRAQDANTNGSCLTLTLIDDTAVFAVNSPATNANGVFDLYFKTNLADAEDWTWIQRGGRGQTNLVVSNLPPDQCYFTLQVTNAIRPGFDAFALPREDDGPSASSALPFTIHFFGTNYSSLYVNNNGNVTFDDAKSAYVPSSLTNVNIKIIAPFWADVDTSDPASDVVTYGSGVVDGRNAFGVDWVNVGYFWSHADRLLSCQLVIIDRSDITPGDFDMEFNYDKVQWEYGDASGAVPAHAGFTGGTAGGGYELPGSGLTDAFLDSSVATGLIYHNLNSSVPGRYVFSFRNGLLSP